MCVPTILCAVVANKEYSNEIHMSKINLYYIDKLQHVPIDSSYADVELLPFLHVWCLSGKLLRIFEKNQVAHTVWYLRGTLKGQLYFEITE